MDDAKIDVKQILNFEGFREARIVECEIIKLGANGDGLAVHRLHDLPEGSQERTNAIGSSRIEVLVVPFVVPGDKVKVKLYKAQTYYQLCDLVEIVEASPDRDDSLVNCQYFAKCSGCQFQMMPYDKQLLHKQKVIENAYKYFSQLPTDLVPAVDPCVASPLKYNYRTKLTPHFDVPRKKALTELPPIGFGMKGRSVVVDIEECSIGTPVINQGMKEQREIVKDKWASYKRGVTILLRENTSRAANDDVASESKACVTDPKQIITEFVNNYRFEFPAGSFFQNNNSILPLITDYVRNNLRLSAESTDGPKYLVDAYCGSGLFSITCSTGVESVIGVEISADSVRYAEINAKLNNVQNTKFIVGEAEKIFANSLTPANETSVILDPPRKGCDSVFLDQLITYLPKKIVYISCNVHSQ
ncbi:S-adenosyl-L-methionine-dependent methyltransferase, partial [Nadsonia fulvescens var. elongata DSM 6958]